MKSPVILSEKARSSGAEKHRHLERKSTVILSGGRAPRGRSRKTPAATVGGATGPTKNHEDWRAPSLFSNGVLRLRPLVELVDYAQDDR